MLTSADLLLAADANRAEFTREHARWLPPTSIAEHEGGLLCAAVTKFPAGPWNSVMGLGRGPAHPELLKLGREFFFAKRRSFTIYVRAHCDQALVQACQEAGYVNLGSAPGMALTERLPLRELPNGVSVREVQNAQEAETFVDIQAESYETMMLPSAVTRKLLGHPERWLTSYCSAHVLFAQGRPVAGGMLLYSHGIAGVYWVGTRPDARGQGHAETLMRALGETAFARGARAVILQASAQGEPVYKRIGYREITRYPGYLAAYPKD